MCGGKILNHGETSVELGGSGAQDGREDCCSRGGFGGGHARGESIILSASKKKLGIEERKGTWAKTN